MEGIMSGLGERTGSAMRVSRECLEVLSLLSHWTTYAQRDPNMTNISKCIDQLKSIVNTETLDPYFQPLNTPTSPDHCPIFYVHEDPHYGAHRGAKCCWNGHKCLLGFPTHIVQGQAAPNSKPKGDLSSHHKWAFFRLHVGTRLCVSFSTVEVQTDNTRPFCTLETLLASHLNLPVDSIPEQGNALPGIG